MFENTFSVNVFGTAIAAEVFLPLLKRSKAGPRIVNVGSGAGSCTQMAEARIPVWMVRLKIYNFISCNARLNENKIHYRHIKQASRH